MKMARLRMSLLLFGDEVMELILLLSFFEVHNYVSFRLRNPDSKTPFTFFDSQNRSIITTSQ